ncbi:MAG TPA: Flp pilus assembly complex ATPase component TadA [Candidatus Merdicola faecigallinarum]|uniref:Flp pilus assembly complex ATPase component TadA n=1 Tax=Candidatus Merdicola faecigallinarum TaxID=2840862 RepID=A0A9D1M2G2_9FIRM|nr:Flp pilus assembly complex ATPase component TadA [Candidatus Merdicola faecigallinarum]
MIVNIILILVILVAVVGFIVHYISKKKKEEPEVAINVDDKTYTLQKMTEYVKKRLDEITKINLYDIGLSEEELKRRKNKKYELKKALKGCTYGDVNDKKYVKELIYDILSKEYGIDETNISKAIPFDVPSLLTPQDKFDIIIYAYKKEFGYEALTELIKKYNLAVLKYVAGESKPCYVITEDEISEIYEKEGLVLNFSDKLNVVVQRIYQHYKGYSSIDEVRDMNIDGVSGGVSGLPESFLSQVAQTDSDYLNQVAEHKVPRACDSIWIFFQGKSIRLAFLSFGTEAELKRVCQNIYKYNNPGQLSDTNGYKINEMKDGSRVVVVRPSFSETWAFFVRKFDVKRATLEQLITIPGKEQAIALLKFLVKGARIISLTGEQGCGKTTMLMGMIENIYETMNIRVQETAFELHLRKIYPTRNILTFRETDTISGQEGLDVQKKTDGSVNIIGEVATDPVASWMIQAAQVASKFTLFTHHAKTFPNLVTALRNSMLRTGVFKDEKTAEEQVIQVLNFDIHLVKDFRGRRYIERVTECIPVEDKNDYTYDHRKEKTLEGKFDKFFDNATRYFSKVTNKELYTYRNIMEYVDGTYVLTNKISDQNINEMRLNMDDNDIEEFDNFIEENWGERPKDLFAEEKEEKTKAEEVAVKTTKRVQTVKRGRKPKQTNE